MNKEQAMVKEFHEKYEVSYYDTPQFPHKRVKQLRKRLVREETKELIDAINSDDMVSLADAIGDSLYVIYGTAVSYGIDMEPIFAEIHRSNMTKDLVKKDGFGKVQKGKNFSPPDLIPILKRMIEQ